MSEFRLGAPRDAEVLVAQAFGISATCTLDARDDVAFKEASWLNLGRITLFPSAREHDHVLASVRRGEFEWETPDLDTASTKLMEALVGVRSSSTSDTAKINRLLDAIATIVVRVGLVHPRFDPHAIGEMPYRRATSIVADTSGLLQGALDFVARYLYPAARVKVPAIVQMEVVNFAHRFFSGRRSERIKGADLLLDHLKSQGGQRVLLRLELQSDVEIERTFLLGDPLREAFQADKDPELKNLNLSTAVPAYCDRLILEAARHHQAQASPGHRVQLLTSDQALARMALAEGIYPLHFRSVAALDFFGQRLTGATLHPFNGRLHSLPLTAVLWEIATAFGNVRLTTPDGNQFVEITATGEGLSWSPYQSRSDLLWIRSKGLESTKPYKPPAPVTPSSAVSGQSVVVPEELGRRTGSSDATAERAQRESPAGWCKFSVPGMIALMDRLEDRRAMSEAEVFESLGVTRKSSADEYRRFLASGGLIEIANQRWEASPSLQKLVVALRQLDVQTACDCLLQVPTFSAFVDSLRSSETGKPWDARSIGRAGSTYMTLGEILQIGASIHGEGYYITPTNPTAEEFSPIALRKFRELAKGDDLISVGGWLEALIRDEGIHPEVTRRLLSEASGRGLIERSTEGSTTDTRHDNHELAVLRIRDGQPTIERVRLYRGDYLIPGKSSTSLRIKEPGK